MQLAMTDEDVVLRFARIVGVGKVYHYPPKPLRKPVWYWACTRRDHITLALMRLMEYFGERRLDKAQQALVRAERNLGSTGARTHCVRGHPLDRQDSRQRYCSVCKRESKRRSREKTLGE